MSNSQSFTMVDHVTIQVNSIPPQFNLYYRSPGGNVNGFKAIAQENQAPVSLSTDTLFLMVGNPLPPRGNYRPLAGTADWQAGTQYAAAINEEDQLVFTPAVSSPPSPPNSPPSAQPIVYESYGNLPSLVEQNAMSTQIS